MTDREHLLLDFASELMPLTGHLSEVALVVPLHYQRLGKACRALSEGLRRWARRGLTPADLVDAGACPPNVWQTVVASTWVMLHAVEEVPGKAARRACPAIRELCQILGPPSTGLMN